MREKLLQAAGIRRPAISGKQGAVLRTRLGLSRSKYRKHRNFLKDIGVRVQSEHKEREFQDSIQCGEINILHKPLEIQDKIETPWAMLAMMICPNLSFLC